MTPKEMALIAAKALDEKKGGNIAAIEITEQTTLSDYFVIATGTSSTHVKSLAEEVEFQLGEQGVKPLRTEGYDSKNWILLDYGEVIVHVFYPEARSFYDLEHLWADAEPVDMKFEEEADGQ